ncbi:MAG: ABC transporter ATP-binding protein [Cyanobacteria bacterium J06641_5]
MARVELQEVARRYGNVVAIEDITFAIPDGEFWVLVGPSGCGKSTILRAIAGLDPIDSGQLYIGDRAVNDVPARARDVAMVFQNYALYPHMSVAENLAFGLRLRGQLSRAEIAERVETVARSLGIAHLLTRKPKQLSGGQQQRVALGRAIVRAAQAFLLDEPLSNLDAQLRDETRTELKRLHGQLGTTTIYVTHDQVEAMTLADRIVVLDRGRIQQIGTPQEIYTHPANRMVATFLGNPPTNILPATVTVTGLRIGDRELAASPELLAPLRVGQAVDLGIRPEDLSLVAASTDDNSTDRLPVEIDVVEPLGRETLVRAKVLATEATLSLQTDGLFAGKPGDRWAVVVPLARATIFQATTGERLYPPT